MKDVFLVSAVRTAIGAFGGSLRDQPPTRLAALVAREALARSNIAPASIELSIFGQVIQTEPRDAYLARVAAVDAGAPHSSSAFTINRLCGSGLQAILTAAQSIMLGDCQIALAGGAEVMSRAPFLVPAMRWGRSMGDSVLIDALNGALTNPFEPVLMGVTAENVAERYAIDRRAQDALAAESHRRTDAAIKAGYFVGQIVPVDVAGKRGTTTFATDEHVRAGTNVATLAELRPIFRREGGTVTAGNASGVNDGAAAVILASGQAVEDHRMKPLARLVSWGHGGVDPMLMGMGPVPATRQALKRAGLSVADLSVIESNEAFAAQACAVALELDFDPERTNPNGSGISLGHPVGATGAINTVKLIHELHRVDGRYGLATMCIGGGQGITIVFERI